MTNEKILKKAVEKAVKNGFINFFSFTLREKPDKLLIQNNYFAIIFDQDFAKAFFGEEIIAINVPHNIEEIDGYEDAITWKVCLKQMVLEKDPLKYIEKYLRKEYEDQVEAEKRG